MGLGAALGAGVGAAMGSASGNIPVWLAVGIAKVFLLCSVEGIAHSEDLGFGRQQPLLAG